MFWENVHFVELLTGEYTTSNKCSDSPYWHEWYSRLRFSWWIIFLVYYALGLPALYFLVRRKQANVNRIIPPYTYGVGLCFLFLYTLLATIGDGLLDCQKINALKYVKIWGAVDVFRFLANLVILAIVALPVVQAMTRHAGLNVGVTTLVHAALLVLLLCFAIIFLTFYIFDVLHIVAGGKLVDAKHFGIPATYVSLYLFTAVTSGSLLALSCLKLIKEKAPIQGIFPFGGLLGISIILLAVWDVILIFRYNVTTHAFGPKQSAAWVSLGIWFQAIVFTLVALLACSKSLAEGRAADVHQEKEPQNGHSEHMANNGTHTNGSQA